VLTDAIGPRLGNVAPIRWILCLPERLMRPYIVVGWAKTAAPSVCTAATLGNQIERFHRILIEDIRRQAALLAGPASGCRGRHHPQRR